MHTLISWQEFLTPFDSLYLAAASAMWWFGAILSMLAFLAALFCILRWHSGAGERPMLPSQSEFMGFGHAKKRCRTPAWIAAVYPEMPCGAVRAPSHGAPHRGAGAAREQARAPLEATGAGGCELQAARSTPPAPAGRRRPQPRSMTGARSPMPAAYSCRSATMASTRAARRAGI
jgi:hypothetical protein